MTPRETHSITPADIRDNDVALLGGDKSGCAFLETRNEAGEIVALTVRQPAYFKLTPKK